MLHDIEPHNLNNNYSPRPAKADDTVLYFSGRDFMMAEDGFPVKAMYPDDAVLTYLFEYDGKAVYLSDRGPLRGCHTEQQAMIRSFEQPVTFMLATAKHLWSWYSKSRFCGCCGSENIHSLTERAMVCPKCGNTVYPRISPAIIVAVTCNDRLLMAENINSRNGMHSLIAGYLEIGESFEMAVKREVLEETGLHISNIRYYGNQPWPFSDGHMIGFFADGDDSEEIIIQKDELKEAGWYTRDALPRTPDKISIAASMISAWADGKYK